MKKNFVLESIFLIQQKGKINEDGKIADGHISIEDYMIYEKIWGKLKMKNMGDSHDHYFKKRCIIVSRCI